MRRFLMWRFERRLARGYMHARSFRSCNEILGGLCVRCFIRDITGMNRRAKAAYIEELRRRFP